MENTEKEQALFMDNVAEESQNILENEAETNEHIAYVKKMLATISATETKQNVADYGIDKLSEDEDIKLATYFFILSNLKEFSKDERDFFTDIMLYCEAPEYQSLMQLKEQYKKIRPTI